jgi:flavodoxin
MHALVIYDSQYGNTERIAQTIAEALRAFGPAEAVHVDPAQPLALEEADLVVVGSPTQGWRATPAMQAALTKIPEGAISGRAVASFDTRFHKPRWLTGSAAQRLEKQLRGLGAEPIVPAESFFVDGSEGPLEGGEIERAAQWAARVHERYEATHPHPVAH